MQENNEHKSQEISRILFGTEIMNKVTNRPSNYISIRESRKIIRDNIKKMKYYESLKKKIIIRRIYFSDEK